VIAGAEATRSKGHLRCERVGFLAVGFVIGNYRKLQQWIYEFCYQLGSASYVSCISTASLGAWFEIQVNRTAGSSAKADSEDVTGIIGQR